MPLHDVKCSKCGHIEEFFYQPGSRPDQITCSKCNLIQDFKPLLSSPRIVMAGERPIERQLEQDASNGVF